MAFNVSDFRAHIGNSRPPSPAHYEVVLSAPPNILKGAETKMLTYRAISCDLPSRNVETFDRRYGGPLRNIPIGHNYTTLQIEFQESVDRETRRFFDLWQTEMFNVRNAYKTPFYNDIIAPEMRIRLFNSDSAKVVREYILTEVYPVTINPTQLAWRMQNEILSTPIEFMYHKWEVTKTGYEGPVGNGIELELPDGYEPPEFPEYPPQDESGGTVGWDGGSVWYA